MTPIYLAQLFVPIGLVLWILLVPPRSMTGWLAQIAGSLLILVALAYVGIWLFPPWWTPHVAAVLLMAVGIWRWRQWRSEQVWVWLPTRAIGRAVMLLFAGLAVIGISATVRAVIGAQAPALPGVALAWPMSGVNLLVANGGNDILINAHLESQQSSDPRLVPWRGNGWAVDFVAIGALGLRSTGFMPTDPTSYRIFGRPVLAPCTGSVIVAVDGLPDMSIPEYDHANLAGNHVMLACGDFQVAIAHLRQGSLRVAAGDAVRTGQPLGEAGNSGGTNEPHLHMHAQRPGPPGALMGGDPLPMRIGGRFLVRGDRLSMPTVK